MLKRTMRLETGMKVATLTLSAVLLCSGWAVAVKATETQPRPLETNRRLLSAGPRPESRAEVLALAAETQPKTRKAISSRPDPDAERIWNRAGIFVAFQGLDPVALGRKLKANHFSWAIVPLHDPNHLMDKEWIAKLQDQGILVGGWAYLRKNPEEDAAKYSRMLREFGLSFFVANAEAEYKTDTGGDYDRSARFVKAFRALEPKIPAALSSFGYLGDWSKMGSEEDRKKMRIFDFAAWYEGGFRWMPQLYWQSYEDYEPERAIKWALAKGWPKDRIHPTIGLYDPDQGGPRRHTAHEYVQKLRKVNTVGVSVYSANSILDGDYGVVGAAIGPDGIAR